MLSRHSAHVLALLAALVAPGLAHAEVNRLDSPLDCSAPLPGGLNGCLLRLPSGQSAPSVEATNPDGTSGSASWRLLGPSEVAGLAKIDLSGTLIVVDLTLGKDKGRVPYFKAEKAAIHALVAALPPEELVALSTFGATRTDVVPFTRDRQAVLGAIDALTLTETTTLLQRNLLDAIQIVKAQSSLAIGRILLVSDGLDEDAALPVKTITLAQQTGVSISALGSYWQRSGAEDIGRGRGYLEAIVTGTAGEFAAAEYRKKADADRAVTDLAARLWQVRNSSRLVALAPGVTPAPAKITVKVDRPLVSNSATRVQVDYTADYVPLGLDGKPLPPPAPPKPAPAPEAKAPSPVVKPPVLPVPQPVAKRDYLAEGMKLAKDHWYVLAGLGAALLIGLIGVLVAKRSKSEEDDLVLDDEGDELGGGRTATAWPPGPTPVLAPEPPRAVLFDKHSGRRIELREARLSIGRGSKNDIILEDDSVSRAHAILQLGPDGGAAITDLQSLNGTFVNGVRVGETKGVQFGDAIKLGDRALILQHP
ncbi:FHA domain-containing protein [Rhodobacter maris]|uniref:von Willebrand factor type A domain-containing protein n=1 Tax=Rhodobacter maris TaxID=446682 RepID=A0A285TLP8_9RHOB|nr:FHA domain-containing protein [Rhodobacter maris]SOC21401.1 von Willebrand factor type A domain-containing protein [Rhodobacter maris]